MSLLTFILGFGKKTVETVTLADIEARLDEKARLELVSCLGLAVETVDALLGDEAKLEYINHLAVTKTGYRYVPVPPGACVIDNSASPVEVARNAGMVVTDFTVYDRDGRVPAKEWAQLDRDGEQYLASLPPMRRDPKTGRPTRD